MPSEASTANVYRELGIEPIINATGVFTRFGGSIMAPEVLAAMVQASKHYVSMEELQLAAGRVIAEITGAESGYVCTGAYSGIVLCIAACMTGLDPAKIDRLPDGRGMRNEVVMEAAHRNTYDHAVELPGARIVAAGPPGGGCRIEHLQAALSPNTAALFFLPDRPDDIPLVEIVRMAHAGGVPVVVDAAGRLDEPNCLRSYCASGADLVVFSGGKWIAGPQSTGIIAGRKARISIIALQQLDLDVDPATWTVPRALVPVEELAFLPRMGIGRGYKVGKEEIVGLLTALRRFTARDHEAQRRLWSDRLRAIAAGLDGLPGVAAEYLAPGVYRRGVPHLRIRFDERILGTSCRDILAALHRGHPAIYPIEREVAAGALLINPFGLIDDGPAFIVRRLKEILVVLPSADAVQ